MELTKLNKLIINKEFLEWYKLNFPREEIKALERVNFSFLAQHKEEKFFKPLFISIKLNNEYIPIIFNMETFNEFIFISEKEEKETFSFYTFFIEFSDEKNFINELKNLLINIFIITNKENYLLVFYFFKKFMFILNTFFENLEIKESIKNNLNLIKIKKLFLENNFEKELKIFLLEELIDKFFNIKSLIKNKVNFYSTIFFDDLELFIYLTNLNLKAKDLKKFLFYFEHEEFSIYLNKIINFCKNLNYNKNYFNITLQLIFEIYHQYKDNKFYFEILEKLINSETLKNKLSSNSNSLISNKTKKEILELISYYYENLLKEKKPLNQKQNEFLEFLYLIKNPYYKLKENGINEFIKIKGIKNIKFNFSQYFEEKKFEINFKFKNKEDIIKFEKEIKIFLNNYSEIWEKI